MISLLSQIVDYLRYHLRAIRNSANRPVAIAGHVIGCWLLLSVLNLFSLGLLLSLFKCAFRIVTLPGHAFSWLSGLFQRR